MVRRAGGRGERDEHERCNHQDDKRQGQAFGGEQPDREQPDAEHGGGGDRANRPRRPARAPIPPTSDFGEDRPELVLTLVHLVFILCD